MQSRGKPIVGPLLPGFLEKKNQNWKKEANVANICTRSYNYLNELFFYPEFSSGISKNCVKRLECKFVSKFPPSPPPPGKILGRAHDCVVSCTGRKSNWVPSRQVRLWLELGSAVRNTKCCFLRISFIRQWLNSLLLGPGLFFSFVIFFIQSVGLLGRVISPSEGRYLHTGQHKHRINAHTDIHALSGIHTHDPSVLASEDSSRLRSRGHYDRLFKDLSKRHLRECGWLGRHGITLPL
jgi:hypothetical protein